MFSKNIKSILIVTMLLVLVLGSAILYADCEMMAMMAKKGDYISWLDSQPNDWDDPYDFFQFMENESTSYPQNDGYGAIYYSDNGYMYFNKDDYFDVLNQAWYKTNRDYGGHWDADSTWYGDPNSHWQWNHIEPLDDYIKPIIMNSDTKASIVMGHDRAGTGGHGNHPFRLQIEIGGKYYTFEHNGYFTISDIKAQFYNRTEALHPGWFSENIHESNWDGAVVNNPQYNSQLISWIDSELYFHYILANIEDADGDVTQGIYNALSYVFDDDYEDTSLIGSNERANFIFSDGFSIYAYRGTNIGDYDIKYTDCDTFWGITTGTESGTQLGVDHLAIFSPYGNEQIIDLANPPIFASGIIDENSEWNSEAIITGDLTLMENITLDIDGDVNFTYNCDFKINGLINLSGNSSFNVSHFSEANINGNGELVLNEGAGLHLTDHSAVIIDGENALLTLDWGTFVSGYEHSCKCPGKPGDRIIAKNGGVINAGDFSTYNGQTEIQIYSDPNSELGWNEGIRIEDDSENYTCEFTNCIFTGTQIQMSGENSTGNLNIYYSTFDNCDRISVTDINRLTIAGSSDDRCEIKNGHSAIVAYGSDVAISYTDIHDNLFDGLHLTYQSTGAGEGCGIFNCNIYNNGRNGIYLNDYFLRECLTNFIYDNEGHGFYGWNGYFVNPIEENVVLNNLQSEFLGKTDFFNIVNGGNTFNDTDPNSGYDWDQYVLASLDWETGDEQVPVYGNNIPQQNDHTRFFPLWETFDFTNGGEVPYVRQLLNLALGYVSVEAYDLAIPILKEIIEDYPDTKEAAIALKTLYFIENKTNMDYAELRDYIDSIQADSSSKLAGAKEDVVIKTHMKEKDYLIAIAKIEEKIAGLTSEDEILYAMLDEAYCELMVLLAGNRASFAEYTVCIISEEDFFVQTKELESRLSAFNEFGQQPEDAVISSLIMHKNYPNPFNPTTTISYSIPSDGNIEISVFNIKGQKVKQLVNDNLTSGQHSVIWNGTDSNDKSVSSGIYFYKISTARETQTKKMLLLK